LLKWMKSLWSSQNAAAAKVVVGLGNPGASYEKTRHNIGFQVVRLVAERHGLTLRSKPSLSAELAKSADLILMLPMTYMNSSGESVRKCVKSLGVALSDLMVVVDDIALPFGQMRMKEGGSAGGHNGLKSIEAHLGTQSYPRLRIGVGSPTGQKMDDYVLGQFSLEEQSELPDILKKAAEGLDVWRNEGIKAAMTKVNMKGEK
jgi:PTH1 family peptidyl-tRNA hydrolase